MVNSRIVITGATGFIGSRLLEKLSCIHRDNILCPVRKSGDIDKIKKLKLAYVFCDLLDSSSLAEVFSEDDIVLHLANITHSRKKGKIMRVNVEGTRNLVSAGGKRKVKKIIYISSINAKFKTGEYALSKYEGEAIIKSSGIDYTIIRPTLVYDDYGEKDIKKLVTLIRKAAFLPVVGDGNYKFQPLHIDNLVDFVILSIEKGFPEKTVEVGGLTIISFNEILQIISRRLNRKIYRIFIPTFITCRLSFILNRISDVDVNAMAKDRITADNYLLKTDIPIRNFEDDLTKIIKNVY